MCSFLRRVIVNTQTRESTAPGKADDKQREEFGGTVARAGGTKMTLQESNILSCTRVSRSRERKWAAPKRPCLMMSNQEAGQRKMLFQPVVTTL